MLSSEYLSTAGRDRAAVGRPHSRGARPDCGRPRRAPEVVPSDPDRRRGHREHLRGRGAPPRRAPPALAGRLDEARASRGAGRGDRRRARDGARLGRLFDRRLPRRPRRARVHAGRVPGPHARRAAVSRGVEGTIERIVVGGRSTYFCPDCQVKLRKRPKRRKKRPKRSGAVSEAPPLPDGFEVGHWSDREGMTGCTVVLPPPEEGAARRLRARAAGRGPARPTASARSRAPRDARPSCSPAAAHSASPQPTGSSRWLEERGRGHWTPAGRVPIVPAAGGLRPRQRRPKAQGRARTRDTRRA